MSLAMMLLIWRAWLTIAMLLLLNSVAAWVFKPSWQRLRGLIKSIPFIVAWPLAIFSPAGRAILLNRLQKL